MLVSLNMGLFGRSKAKGDSRVGPILYGLCETVDHGNRATLAKFLSRAPSGSELVATYKHAPPETAQTILSAFQQTGLPGHAVAGAEVFGDGFAIYIKGDFADDALSELAQTFRQSGERFGFEVEVASGRFDSTHLKELP